MSMNTSIQWCDDTINPTKGCDGCPLWNPNRKTCYAGKMTARFGGSNPGFAKEFNVAETAPDRMEPAARWPNLAGTTRESNPSQLSSL